MQRPRINVNKPLRIGIRPGVNDFFGPAVHRPSIYSLVEKVLAIEYSKRR